MDSKIIKELNAYLKGEYMAIDSYEKFIQKVHDKTVKAQLQSIQKDHKQHAILVAERIQSLGGTPASELGLEGKMASMLSSIKHMGATDTASILKEAYEGESKGIAMAQEVVKGDLDADSSRLVNSLLNEDRTHLSTLQGLMK